MLTAYEQLLKEWKECYAPSEPESDWDARFIVAYNVLPQVSYMLACLTSADPAERAWMADELLHDQTLEKIRCMVAAHTADDTDKAA